MLPSTRPALSLPHALSILTQTLTPTYRHTSTSHAHTHTHKLSTTVSVVSIRRKEPTKWHQLIYWSPSVSGHAHITDAFFKAGHGTYDSTLTPSPTPYCGCPCWDRGAPPPSTQGHSEEVICLSFTTVGDILLTGSFDQTINTWDAASGRCHPNPTPHRPRTLHPPPFHPPPFTLHLSPSTFHPPPSTLHPNTQP